MQKFVLILFLPLWEQHKVVEMYPGYGLLELPEHVPYDGEVRGTGSQGGTQRSTWHYIVTAAGFDSLV